MASSSNNNNGVRIGQDLSKKQVNVIVCCTFVIATCCKVLLFPSYRSTDFLVHRHWKAVTRSLPVQEWYFDDNHVDTVHTLDYPPGFAWFEYMLANNPLTNALIRHGIIDGACLQLQPDIELGTYHNEDNIAYSCVVFMRSTVVVSDVVFWLGAAWVASSDSSSSQLNLTTLFLLVLNPGFLWLDHVHFQYNGMIYGLLLFSIGCLLRGNNSSDKWSRVYSIGAAISFALLLTFKHLFLVLVPWYTVYLLQRFCFVTSSSNESHKFSLRRFVVLATITATTILIPTVPFLLNDNSCRFLSRLISRLFPFQRGLLHDYWAGNIWVFYAIAGKVIKFVLKRDLLLEPSPRVVAAILFIGLLPSAYGAWIAAKCTNNRLMLITFRHASLTAFMLGYHVHEKAILTAMVSLILLVTSIDCATASSKHGSAFIGGENMTGYTVACFGLLGLFPLLFSSTELLLTLTSYTAYVAAVYYILISNLVESKGIGLFVAIISNGYAVFITCCIVILEFLPARFWGKLSFLPLALTSLTVASGLIIAWIFLSVCMNNVVTWLGAERSKQKVA